LSLKDRKIIVAVTGSIAAYKALLLVRLLIKEGTEVKVLMTEAATKFVSQLSFSTLSKNPVYTSVIDGDAWNNHVDLGLWADVMIVAPATAATLGRAANGIADNIVCAVYLSAKCPVFFAPAMDRDMWIHGSTQNNIKKLESYGNHIIPVGDGELASGLEGKGRLAEPEDIVSYLDNFLSKKKDLIDKQILITAGPTIEKIDPVRYLTNPSSGKMGISIAENCAERGAKVTLILGPTSLKPQNPRINLIDVQSAQDMYEAAMANFKSSDAAILVAAVADYRPKTYADAKIKKKEGDMSIELERTKDIAKNLGAIKGKNQVLVGFALETNNEIENAKAKLQKKNFDFIVLNSMRDKGAGFKKDTNKISIIRKNKEIKEFPLKSKTQVAVDIVNELVSLM
jgi:phosphopantothenoylcysteine decarboxylase/phosphopantothenate--cysteine ligase